MKQPGSRLTASDVLAQLKKAMPDLQARFKVRSMAVFGSYARGDNQSGSDVDILVDVDPSIGLDFVSLADALQDLLGVPVDLVSRRAVSPRNWDSISHNLLYV